MSIALVLVGIAVGAFGTVIGAGGGFLLVPFLLLWMPSAPPEVVTAISLSVVLMNAISGSLAYARLRRIDYFSGLTFAAAGVPGAFVGVWLVRFIPGEVFRVVFGAALLLGAAYLMARGGAPLPPPKEVEDGRPRVLTDAAGCTYRWSYPLVPGLGIAAGIGVLSSVLGIGGGIVHVPVMVRFLRFPVHVATATSHLTLGLLSLTAVLLHLFHGHLTGTFHPLVELGVGVVLGAQLGARLSHRVRGAWILRGLAGALGLVGLRLLLLR